MPVPNEGFERLSHDPDAGTYVIIESLYVDQGGEITADMLPVTDDGRRLSDEWVENTLGSMANTSDAEERELAEKLETAWDKGNLERKLVVGQASRDGATFDESIAELGIDQVEIAKLGDQS